MKKYRLFFAASILFVLLFGCCILHEWALYTSTLNSAPFRIVVLILCVELLIPAALCATIGLILRRKNKSA